jgi:hypothetical protein
MVRRRLVGGVYGDRPVGGVVGRASNRKKAQRQAGPSSRADSETHQAMHQLVAGLQAMVVVQVSSALSSLPTSTHMQSTAFRRGRLSGFPVVRRCGDLDR